MMVLLTPVKYCKQPLGGRFGLLHSIIETLILCTPLEVLVPLATVT